MKFFELRHHRLFNVFDHDVWQLGATHYRNEINVQLHTVEVTHEQSLHFRATEGRCNLSTCRLHAAKVDLGFLRENARVDTTLVEPDGCIVRHWDDLPKSPTSRSDHPARHGALATRN